MRISLWTAGIIMALGFVSGARADTPPQGVCRALFEKSGLTQDDGFSIHNGPDGCVIENASFDVNRFQSWHFDRAEFAADNLAAAAKGSLPSWGRFSTEGVRLSLKTTTPFVRFITNLQQWPMDVTGFYHWDNESGRLQIEDIRITSVKNGLAALSVDLSAPKSLDISALTNIDAIKISHLRFRLDNQGFFEAFVGPAAGGFLREITGSYDADIDALIKEKKSKFIAGLGAILATQLDDNSRKAFIHFVQDLPHPTGYFSFELSLPKAVPLTSLTATITPEKAAPLFAGSTICVRYSAR